MPSRRRCWDHPRTCGEKIARHSVSILQQGSPPHMRGKAMFFHHHNHLYRITPAHAGKSDIGKHDLYALKDHPRTCGEKQYPEYQTMAELGSPPHMRGKALLIVKTAVHERITPAHAGKRTLSASSTSCCWDHPRTCGEKGLEQD